MFRAALEGSTLPSPVGVSPASSSGPAPSPECLTADGVCLLEIVRREAAAANTTLRPEAPGFNPQNKSTANACETLCC